MAHLKITSIKNLNITAAVVVVTDLVEWSLPTTLFIETFLIVFFKKMGHPRPFLSFIFGFSNKHYNSYNNICE